MKKIPMRMCVITRERFEKRDLARIVRTPEGTVVYDKTGKKNGKGAYLKKDIDIVNKARKSGALDRILEVHVSDEVYDEIIDEIK